MMLLPLCMVAGFFAVNDAAVASKAAEPPMMLLGVLLPQDTKDPVRNQPCKKYSVSLRQGQTYVIEMNSIEFDCFLRFVDPQGKQLAQDDDSGGNLNSRIVFTIPTTGTYEIVATTYNGSLGFFFLNISHPKK